LLKKSEDGAKADCCHGIFGPQHLKTPLKGRFAAPHKKIKKKNDEPENTVTIKIPLVKCLQCMLICMPLMLVLKMINSRDCGILWRDVFGSPLSKSAFGFSSVQSAHR